MRALRSNMTTLLGKMLSTKTALKACTVTSLGYKVVPCPHHAALDITLNCFLLLRFAFAQV